MNRTDILIFDNNSFYYNFLSRYLSNSYTLVYLNNNFIECLNEKSRNIILFINTSLLYNNIKYLHERGGFILVEKYLQKNKQSFPIIFFSFENRDAIKNHLKISWLKYSTNYFIHYPFDYERITGLLKKSESKNFNSLRFSDKFLNEIKSSLVESLRSLKHDYLNRISRVKPELITILDNLGSNSKVSPGFQIDFDPVFLKNELIKISDELQILHHEYINLFSNDSKNKIFTLIDDLNKLPEILNLILPDQNFKKSEQYLREVVSNIDIIKKLFEELIAQFNYEK